VRGRQSEQRANLPVPLRLVFPKTVRLPHDPRETASDESIYNILSGLQKIDTIKR